MGYYDDEEEDLRRGADIDSDYSEGASYRDNDDGSRHESRWYDSGEGSSYRTSRDYDSDGNVSGEHTTQQK